MNLRGPFLCARAAARLIEPGGSIVLQVRGPASGTEVLGVVPIVRAGRAELLRILEQELVEQQIRVYGFDPGTGDEPDRWPAMASEILDLALGEGQT